MNWIDIVFCMSYWTATVINWLTRILIEQPSKAELWMPAGVCWRISIHTTGTCVHPHWKCQRASCATYGWDPYTLHHERLSTDEARSWTMQRHWCWMIKRSICLLKQISYIEIISTVVLLANVVVVVDLSRVFHAIDSSYTSSYPQAHTCSLWNTSCASNNWDDLKRLAQQELTLSIFHTMRSLIR